MAAHLDHIGICCLHRDSADHREVILVHLGTHGCERVHLLGSADGLTNDEGRVDWALVPATVDKDICLAEWDCTHIADLVRHLDREHEPLWLGCLEIEHFDRAQEEGTTFLLGKASKTVEVSTIERAESH